MRSDICRFGQTASRGHQSKSKAFGLVTRTPSWPFNFEAPHNCWGFEIGETGVLGSETICCINRVARKASGISQGSQLLQAGLQRCGDGLARGRSGSPCCKIRRKNCPALYIHWLTKKLNARKRKLLQKKHPQSTTEWPILGT